MKHKFHAKPTNRNGIRFDSKKEANYYDMLCLRQLAGDVVFFLRQVPFDLPGNTKYRVDFQVFRKNGDIDFVDVKGMRTKEFIRAKKQVESIYPITIDEV